MEVVSGIILGLDTDTPKPAPKLLEFIEQSQIPMATINLLQALPQDAALGSAGARRPHRRGRQAANPTSTFCCPMTKSSPCGASAWARPTSPKAVYQRYEHQMRAAWPNRYPRPMSKERVSPAQYPPWSHNARQGFVEDRRVERLSPRVLVVHASPAAARRDRSDPHRLGLARIISSCSPVTPASGAATPRIIRRNCGWRKKWPLKKWPSIWGSFLKNPRPRSRRPHRGP